MATTLANMLKFCLVTAILVVGSRSEDSQKEDISSHKYNIRLDNGTSFEITTHGFQEFSKCLQRGATKGNNTVEIVKFNKCARDLYDRVQSNITDHLRIRDVGELGAALRNLSSLHRLNGNIVKNLEALQNSFQRLRLPPFRWRTGHRTFAADTAVGQRCLPQHVQVCDVRRSAADSGA
ncbi:hypothetical protein MTO96_037250 [Rhipicephalus appendiculatus]